MDTGFKHKKSLGQHFLNNTRVPAQMADAAGLVPGDTVVEIGPGTGVLTGVLLERGARVIALEADARAVTELQARFTDELRSGALRLYHSDVRKFDLSTLQIPRKYKVVSNIPYYLSGMLFRFFLEAKHQPSCLVFLVQKEVADRITKDRKESILSLSVKVFGTPRYIVTVRKGNFTPPPRVDSAIVAIGDISRKRLKYVSEDDFFRVVHAGFRSRRKQLLGNLSLIATRDVLTHMFSTLGLPLDVRGEDLSLSKWLQLSELISTHTESH